MVGEMYNDQIIILFQIICDKIITYLETSNLRHSKTTSLIYMQFTRYIEWVIGALNIKFQVILKFSKNI